MSAPTVILSGRLVALFVSISSSALTASAVAGQGASKPQVIWVASVPVPVWTSALLKLPELRHPEPFAHLDYEQELAVKAEGLRQLNA